MRLSLSHMPTILFRMINLQRLRQKFWMREKLQLLLTMNFQN